MLHDALSAWATKQDAYSFVSVLLNHLTHEDALKLIPMFLHVEKEWLEENTTADEVYEAFKEAVGLNDWSEILQAMIVLDTIQFEEIIKLWQTVKAS